MSEIIYRSPDELTFLQSRMDINSFAIAEYAEMMENGVEFDPVLAIQDETGKLFVWDGYHRGQAARRAGKLLACAVEPGTYEEATWLALSANQKHGLRRSQADKRMIVREALVHPNGAKLSDREIARHCGVSHPTVGQIRKEMEATGKIYQSETRIGADGREINTTRIGQKPDDFGIRYCPECGERKKFSVERLAESEQFECPVCSETVASEDWLKEPPTSCRRYCRFCGHERIMTGLDFNLGIDVSCDHCNRRWPVEGWSKRRPSQETTPPVRQMAGSIECPHCDDAIWPEQDLRPDGSIVCDGCKKRFASYAALLKAVEKAEMIGSVANQVELPKTTQRFGSTGGQIVDSGMTQTAGSGERGAESDEVILYRLELIERFSKITDRLGRVSELRILDDWLSTAEQSGLVKHAPGKADE